MFFVTVTFLYNAWVIPLRSTFPYQTPENRIIWMVFDYLTDFVYLIDMIVIQPKVKYLEDGFWVIDVSLLRNNYLKRRQFKVGRSQIIMNFNLLQIYHHIDLFFQ